MVKRIKSIYFLVALLLADYGVDKHHILKPPGRQNWIIADIQELEIVGLI